MVELDLPVIPGATHIEVLRSQPHDPDPKQIIGRVRNGTSKFVDEAPFEGAYYAYRGVLDVDGDNDFRTGPVSLAVQPPQPPTIVSHRFVTLPGGTRGLTVTTTLATGVAGASGAHTLSFHEEAAATGGFRVWTCRLPEDALTVEVQPSRGGAVGQALYLVVPPDIVLPGGTVYPPVTAPPTTEEPPQMGSAAVVGSAAVLEDDFVTIAGEGSTFDEAVIMYADRGEVVVAIVGGAWEAGVRAARGYSEIQVGYRKGGIDHGFVRVLMIDVTPRQAPAPPLFTIAPDPAVQGEPVSWTAAFEDMGGYEMESVVLETGYGPAVPEGEPFTPGAAGEDQPATVVLLTTTGREFRYVVTYDVEAAPTGIPVTTSLVPSAEPVVFQPFTLTHVFDAEGAPVDSRRVRVGVEGVDAADYAIDAETGISEEITISLSGPAPVRVIYALGDGSEIEEVLADIEIAADPNLHFFDPNALPVGPVDLSSDWQQTDASRPVATLTIGGEAPNQYAQLHTGSNANNFTGLRHEAGASAPLGRCRWRSTVGAYARITLPIAGIHLYRNNSDERWSVRRAGQANSPEFAISGSGAVNAELIATRPAPGQTYVEVYLWRDSGERPPEPSMTRTYAEELAAQPFAQEQLHAGTTANIYFYSLSADPDKPAPTGPIKRAAAPATITHTATFADTPILGGQRIVEGRTVVIGFAAHNAETLTATHSDGKAVTIRHISGHNYEVEFLASPGMQAVSIEGANPVSTVSIEVPVQALPLPAQNPDVLEWRFMPAEPKAGEPFFVHLDWYNDGLDLADVRVAVGGQDASMGRAVVLPEGTHDVVVTFVLSDDSEHERTTTIDVVARAVAVEREMQMMTWQGNDADEDYPNSVAPNFSTHANSAAELLQRPAGGRALFSGRPHLYQFNHPMDRARLADGTYEGLSPNPSRANRLFRSGGSAGYTGLILDYYNAELLGWAESCIAEIKSLCDANSIPYHEALDALTFDAETKPDSVKVSGDWERAVWGDPRFEKRLRPVYNFFLRRYLRHRGTPDNAAVFVFSTEGADRYENIVHDAVMHYVQHWSFELARRKFQAGLGTADKEIMCSNYEQGGQDVLQPVDGTPEGEKTHTLTPWIYQEQQFLPYMAGCLPSETLYGYRSYPIAGRGANLDPGNVQWDAFLAHLREMEAAAYKYLFHMPWASNPGIDAMGWLSPFLTSPDAVAGSSEPLLFSPYSEDMFAHMFLLVAETASVVSLPRLFNSHTAPDTHTHANDVTDGFVSAILDEFNTLAGPALPRVPIRYGRLTQFSEDNGNGHFKFLSGRYIAFSGKALPGGRALYRVTVPRSGSRTPSTDQIAAWGVVTVKGYRSGVEVGTYTVPAGKAGVWVTDNDHDPENPLTFEIASHADVRVNLLADKQDLTDPDVWTGTEKVSYRTAPVPHPLGIEDCYYSNHTTLWTSAHTVTEGLTPGAMAVFMFDATTLNDDQRVDASVYNSAGEQIERATWSADMREGWNTLMIPFRVPADGIAQVRVVPYRAVVTNIALYDDTSVVPFNHASV